MPRLLAGPTGLYAYPNAGVNDAAAIGNLLSGLAETGLKFHTLRQENRTLGDLVGRPTAEFNTARMAPEMGTSMRERFSNSLRSLSGKPQAMLQPAPMPMATPGQMNPLQSLVYGSGLQNFKMRDMKSLGEMAPFLKAFRPDAEDIMLPYKIQELQGSARRHNALADKYNKWSSLGSSGGKGQNRMEETAFRIALQNAKSDPRYKLALLSDDEDQADEILAEHVERNLNALKNRNKPKPGPGPGMKGARKDSLGLFK